MERVSAAAREPASLLGNAYSILETFPIVKRHDEAEFGEYRTKRVIVERFGAYEEAIKRNQSALA